MKINELVKKSELEQIEEGPLGSLGTAVGKGVGGLAKGVGAVAGGVAGLGSAFKKGFAGGKATVAGDPDPNAAAQPAAGGAAQPAAGAAPAAGGAAQPAADPNAAAGAQPPAAKKPGFLAGLKSGLGGKPAAGGAAQPAAGGAAQPSTPLKAAQDAISKLDKPGKQNILKLLQKEVPAAEPAAAAQAPAATPAADPEAAAQAPAATPAADPAAAAPTQQAAATPAAEPAAPTQQAAAPAADPAAAPQTGGKLTAAQQAAKVAELKGKRSAGKTAGTTASGFSQYTKDASSQRIVGANPDGSPKIQTIKASKINIGNNLSESLARKVEQHKRKMFETGLANGTSSIFAK